LRRHLQENEEQRKEFDAEVDRSIVEYNEASFLQHVLEEKEKQEKRERGQEEGPTPTR
jgi:hypothetical protein